jgi:hypothetical protein
VNLQDFGESQSRSWFQQILEWSRKKISFEDNIDCIIIEANIATSETIVDHPLGRVPKGIIPVLRWPCNISELSWTREPTNSRLFIKARVAGRMALLIY